MILTENKTGLHNTKKIRVFLYPHVHKFQHATFPELDCCFTLFSSNIQHVLGKICFGYRTFVFRIFETNCCTNFFFQQFELSFFLQLHLSKLELDHYLHRCRGRRALLARIMFRLRLKCADTVLVLCDF